MSDQDLIPGVYWGNLRTGTWHFSGQCPVVKAQTETIGGKLYGKRMAKKYTDKEGIRRPQLTLHRYSIADDQNMPLIRTVHRYTHVCKRCEEVTDRWFTDSVKDTRFNLYAGNTFGTFVGSYATQEKAENQAARMMPHVSTDTFLVYDAYSGAIVKTVRRTTR